MEMQTSPLIADDDEELIKPNKNFNSNEDNLEFINKNKSTSDISSIIIESSPSTIENRTNNDLNNQPNSLNENKESNETINNLNKNENTILTNQNSNNSFKTNNQSQNIIIPSITIHSGPPPKRNVAVKNTAAHLNLNRNHQQQQQQVNLNTVNNKINSKEVKQTFRVNEDDLMNLEDKDIDSNDEYVPPKHMRDDSDFSESDDSSIKRKSNRMIKKPKIFDEFVIDSDNTSSNQEITNLSTSRITIESNTKSIESQTKSQVSTTSQLPKSTARKSTAPLVTSNMNQFNIQRQQTRPAITPTTSVLNQQQQQNISNTNGISNLSNQNKPTIKPLLNGTTNTSNNQTPSSTKNQTVITQNSTTLIAAKTQTNSSTNLTQTTPQKQYRNKMVSCKPFYQSKATECYPIVKDASTQIDLDEIKLSHTVVPVPVPINIPIPMCMYQAPMPIPILMPVPIPVPVFIPTTKKTFDRVQRRIKKLRKKLPSDPYEFEILLYAEKLAREEGIPGFEDSSDGESESELNLPKQNYLNHDSNALEQDQQIQTLQSHDQLSIIQNETEGSFKWTIGVKVFNTWLTNKIESLKLNLNSPRLPNDLLKLKNEELNVLLAEFLTEVRKPNGEIYAPESIYYICLGIQYYLQEKGRVDNIFLDLNSFDQFQHQLNDIASRYKIRIDPDGQVASRIEEEILWESKQLGAFSPFVLLNTILYFNTKYFFLDKVESHKKLSFTNVKKHSKRNIGPNGEDYGKTVFLRYYPDFHGLEQVIYEQGENYDNPLRCPVELYNFYLSKCPENVKNRNDLFYLLPEKASLPSSPVWFSSQPLGDKMLERMLNRIKMVKEVNELLLAAAPATTSLIVQ